MTHALRRTLFALALIAGISPVIAQQFPTVPGRSVIGRLGTPGDTGPSQAIPFATLQTYLSGGSGGAASTPHTQDFLTGGDFTPGSTTQLTLSSAPTSTDLLFIAFDGVWQNANTWSLSTTVVTFNAAIPLNTQVVEAKWSTVTSPTGVSSITAGTSLTGAVTFLHDATINIVRSSQNITFSLGNYLSTLSNAVSRTFKDKQQDLNTAFDFGVKCDNSTTDTTTLQNAINSTPIGGKLYIPFKNSGTCLIDAGLTFPEPIHLVCDPRVSIKPITGIGSGSVLNFVGSANGLAFPTIIENCFIGDTGANTRLGGIGMFFDSRVTGNYFRGLELRNVTIKAGTTGAFGAVFLNNTVNNPNGGIFVVNIRGGLIEGGLSFSGAGDNIAIRDTLIPWNSTGGADNNGILVDLVAGAGSFLIDHINFSQPGGLVFDACYSCIVQNSQFEGQATSTESNGAIVDVRAGSATILDFKFRNNQVQAVAGVGTPLLLRIGLNVTHVVVDGNAFATPTSYTGVSNASVELQLGPNFWSTAATHVSGTAAANTYGGG